MAESLEIFDVRHFFEPIENRFLDEMIHDNSAGAAVFVEGFLEGHVDTGIDLYGRHSPPVCYYIILINIRSYQFWSTAASAPVADTLLEREHSESRVEKIIGVNFVRLFDDVWR